MAVKVTIQPHMPVDIHTGKRVEFDQYQILIGQRVVGYKSKEPGKPPVLVVRDLPQDAIKAIERACAEVDKKPLTAGTAISQPVTNDPAA